MPAVASGVKRSTGGTWSRASATSARGDGQLGVQHRVDGDQARGLPAVLVAEPQDGRGGQVPAGAGAAQVDALGVDAEVGRRVPQPASRGDAVVERHGVVHAADREPVVDADDDRTGRAQTSRAVQSASGMSRSPNMNAPPCSQSRAGRVVPSLGRLVHADRHGAVRPVDGEVAGRPRPAAGSERAAP